MPSGELGPDVSAAAPWSVPTTAASVATPAPAPPGPVTRQPQGRLAGYDWFDINLSGRPGGSEQQQLEANLSGLLGAQHTIVLCGLGTSLGLNRRAPDGKATSAGAPTMADLYEAISKLDGFKGAEELIPQEARDRRDVETLLSKCQFSLAVADDPILEGFVTRAEAQILELCSFVNSSTDLTQHEIFLRKIARRQSRLARAQIFTTNYDLAFERAAENIHFNIIDGFGFGTGGSFDGTMFEMDIVRRAQGENILQPNVLHLLKLHGSVDWNDEGGVIRRSNQPTDPVLIYPASNKFQLSYRPPYLELMSRLQISLRQEDVALVIIGFGFNDAHITAPIESAIRSNISLQVVVVDPGIAALRSATAQRLDRLIAAGDKRVTLLGTTFDEFVGLLPDVQTQDERELHEVRTTHAWSPT